MKIDQIIAEDADERKQNALWAQITAHEKAAKKSKDLKQQHHLKMADQLRSQLKTSDLNEFAPVGGDDREPDEEEILRQLAARWWSGTEQQMAQAQRTLETLGWEIGPDESGDEDAGVYVYRIGDDDGRDTIAFGHSELSLDEGIGRDMAKLGGIAALGIGAGLAGNYLDQQQPRVEVGGQKAYLIQHPGWGRIPDNAMTLQGKDGKTYTVWASKGKGSTQYYATPADNVKEGVAEGSGNIEVGDKITWWYNKFHPNYEGIVRRVSGNTIDVYAPGSGSMYRLSKEDIRSHEKKGVAEMDSQGYTGSRDRKKTSKYGSRDHYDLGGPESTGRPLTAKQMMDRAHKAMLKSMSNAEKVNKGWRNPNIDEGGEKWIKLPNGNYRNMHTGVQQSKPPVKKKRGEKTGAEWDAIEKAKKDKEPSVAEETIHVGYRNSSGDWIKTTTHDNYRDAKAAMERLVKAGKKGVQHRYDNKGNIDPGAMMTARPDSGVTEGLGNIGSAIKSLYQKIYRAGDDEIEYFYNASPIFAQYWDEYEGDLDSIIAEVDPSELEVIKAELESYVDDANLAEGDVTRTPTGLIHRAKDKYGAGEEPFSPVNPGKYARDLDHVNKQQVKDLDASMGITWKNRGTKGVEVDESEPREKEADYGPDYQDMVARVKKLAGLGPLKTVYDPQKRVYKNVPTAVQPKK